MSQIIRNGESRSSAVITPERDGGVRIEERESEAAPPAALPYRHYLRVLDGRGTVCLPLSAAAEIPPPAEAANPAVTEDEIKRMWDKVLADSSRQVTKQTADQARQNDESKTRKLERLLSLALKSGNMDLAILLFSGLEAKKANEVSTALMQRMQQLQEERRKLSSQMASTGDQAKDAQNAQAVNAKMGDIGTEMNLLQTLLQDIQARKNEAQQMASNFIKSRHDTGMGIIRNMG
jgi:hypothetical protein